MTWGEYIKSEREEAAEEVRAQVLAEAQAEIDKANARADAAEANADAANARADAAEATADAETARADAAEARAAADEEEIRRLQAELSRYRENG